MDFMISLKKRKEKKNDAQKFILLFPLIGFSFDMSRGGAHVRVTRIKPKIQNNNNTHNIHFYIRSTISTQIVSRLLFDGRCASHIRVHFPRRKNDHVRRNMLFDDVILSLFVPCINASIFRIDCARTNSWWRGGGGGDKTILFLRRKVTTVGCMIIEPTFF